MRPWQHPAEPVLRLCLQRRWYPGGGGRALPAVRHDAFADHRRGGDGAVLGQRHRQFAAAQDARCCISSMAATTMDTAARSATATMNIGRCRRATGVSERMIRHYERIGLMPPPDRRDNGYRDYSPQSVERLRFIANARDLGFSLEEIATLLGLWDDRERTPAARSRPLRSHMPRILVARRQRLKPCVAPCWNWPKVAAATADPIVRSLQDWLNHVAARLGN
jgi:DNA-binding transcriptional MerR regulator